MIRPDFIRKGDTVAIVAPAGKIDKIKVDSATRILENWGLKVVLGQHMFEHYFTYSAEDKYRLKDIQDAFDNPDVKAVLCARGGYGSARIIDQIDFTSFIKNPCWLIGFSDITVFHNHIQQNFGVQTLHGSMAAGFLTVDTHPETTETLRKALFGENIEYTFPSLSGSRFGKCEGILTGGNLAILCSLLETESSVETEGKVLFIEEIGEYPYRIDRMMNQLKRAGKFSSLAGLLVGGMTDVPGENNDFGKSAYEIIAEHIADVNCPVAFGFPAGHQDDNRALVLGSRVSLNVSEISKLVFNHHNSSD